MKKMVSPGGFVSHAVTAALAAGFLLVLGFALSTFAAPPPESDVTVPTKIPQPTVTRPRVALRMAAAKRIATLPFRTVRVRGPRTRAVDDGGEARDRPETA